MSYPTPEVFLSFRVAVILPAAQALVTGFLVGYLTVAFSYLLQLPNAWINGGLTSSVTAIAAWLLGIIWWRDRVLDYLGVDTAGHPATVRVEWVENDGRTLHFDDLPGTPKQIKAVANLALTGGTLSQGNLEEIFRSRRQVQKFQKAMVDKGYARRRNAHAPTTGIETTDQGMIFFQQVINPLPQLRDNPKQQDPPVRTRAHKRGGG